MILGPDFGYRKYSDNIYEEGSSDYYLVLANNALYEKNRKHDLLFSEERPKTFWVELTEDECNEIDSMRRMRAIGKDIIVCKMCGKKMKMFPGRELSIDPSVIYICPECKHRVASHHVAENSQMYIQ